MLGAGFGLTGGNVTGYWRAQGSEAAGTAFLHDLRDVPRSGGAGTFVASRRPGAHAGGGGGDGCTHSTLSLASGDRAGVPARVLDRHHQPLQRYTACQQARCWQQEWWSS